jgi:hypothetical protein
MGKMKQIIEIKTEPEPHMIYLLELMDKDFKIITINYDFKNQKEKNGVKSSDQLKFRRSNEKYNSNS